MDKTVGIASVPIRVRIALTMASFKSVGTVRITKDDNYGHKKDDVVTFVRYGTYGGWDEQGRWIDFFNTELI